MHKRRNIFDFVSSNLISYRELDFTHEIGNNRLNCDFVINCATTTSASKRIDEEKELNTALNAAKLVLNSAKRAKTGFVAVNLSSGAVFGRQSIDVTHQPERSEYTNLGECDYYTKSKILTEHVFNQIEKESNSQAINARLYSFFGPGLPLGEQYAIGNFMRDVMEGNRIKVQGNPDTLRSYMYPTDLVLALIRILINPVEPFLNIGSDSPISIAKLASLMSDLFEGKGVHFVQTQAQVSNYVPCIDTLRTTYSFDEFITLEEGLLRWKEWLQLYRHGLSV